MTQTKNSVLSAHGISKRFGNLQAVNDVDLSLRPGARHALIGPNGAGKTTFINLLTGVLHPTAGQVILNGEDVSKYAPYKRVHRGLVRTFQINQLFATLTPLQTLGLVISENIGLASKPWHLFGNDKRVVRRCEELLESFRLTDDMNQKVEVLPYGKRRQLEIAIAFACEPKVLLLDEPVAGVPMGEREELLRIVADLPDTVAVLLIEHDMDLVFSFADTVTVLVNGTLQAEGSPEEIASNPAVQEAYLGKTKPAVKAPAATQGDHSERSADNEMGRMAVRASSAPVGV